MSKLEPCPKCGHQISKSAHVCPSCGHTFTRLSNVFALLGLLIIVGFLLRGCA